MSCNDTACRSTGVIQYMTSPGVSPMHTVVNLEANYDIETVKALRDRECYRLALDMCIDLYSDLSVTHEVAFKFLSDNGLLTHCYRDFELVQLQDNAEKWQSILNSFDFGGCKNGSND